MNKTRYGITAENLLRALPGVLQNDENMLALASSVAYELERLSGQTEFATIYACIDVLPEPVLDTLAKDFKVDWWDGNYSLEEKRRTLKDSWNVHRRMGTTWAVETAISAVYQNTAVEEWFDNGGEPYTFKLLIDATYEQADPEKHRRIIEKAGYYKNLRSHLAGIEYISKPAGTATAYCAVAPAGFVRNMTAEVKVYGVE